MFMLGSASNPPTAQGMRRVLDFVSKVNPSMPLVVAGYGTELLAGEYHELPKSVSIHGSVAPAELLKMLSTCRAVLVFQEASSGALTRLQEMRLAGIPVIGNQVSLRSYGNIRGLHVLTCLEDLMDLCLDELEAPQFSEESFMQARMGTIVVVRETLGPDEVSDRVAPRVWSKGHMQ
jgi:hypothetical protein